MAAGENQRQKLLILAEIFSRETDDQNGLTLNEIAAMLEARGVNAERKTLYRDFEELQNFGYDILAEQDGRLVRYHLGSRTFELPELKLLVDAVQSAKFITERKSRELIGKIEGLASRHDAKYLHRQVLLTGRVKTLNERIYYNVDRLHEALGEGRQVRFHYFRWTVARQMALRRNGDWYQVSPWALIWDDENYYLAAFDAAAGEIRHFRVDKMTDLELLDEPRTGQDAWGGRTAADYSRAVFGMHGGAPVRVSLEGENAMAGPLIDRFGTDLILAPLGPDRFTAQVDVVPSPHFLGWIIALEGVRVTAPESVVQQMRAVAQRLSEQYAPEKGANP